VPLNWQEAPAGNPHRFAFVGDVGGQQILLPEHELLHCELFSPLQIPPQQQVPPQQGFRGESQQVSPQQGWSQQMPRQQWCVPSCGQHVSPQQGWSQQI
jgi:hypothetical protein